MNDKISEHHLLRKAFVYVRQSSTHQVRHHVQGRQRQYDLADRARELGFAQTVVIDEDQGRSGSGLAERPGFVRLLTAVCAGEAGAVFALEASRLARNNRDWHHLIDLCALTETLLIDADGVYDPRALNDRLLLGLKGTMSEFELGLLHQRARVAFEQKVRRGHAMWELPVGFVRSDEQRIEKIADRQVQQVLEGVFRRFRQLGSARQTTLWYRDQQIALPQVVPGSAGHEVLWRLPTGHRINQILKNPCYAGALAYGRTKGTTVIEGGRAKRSASRQRKPRCEWKVLILDNHPGYIGWPEYLEIQTVLESNGAMRDGIGQGAPKRGVALLAGLLRCGQCGRKLHVAYGGNGGRVPRYACQGARVDRGSAACLTLGGLRIDRVVCEQVLEGIQPGAVEAALCALGKANDEQAEARRSLELALEKARYEVARAQRQYDLVDPANRLVAGELEQRWNAALVQVTELEGRLGEIDRARTSLSEAQQRQLLALGNDLRTLWNHQGASSELKKRIVRTVLHEIIIQDNPQGREHIVHLHWKGGVHTELRVARNSTGKHHRITDEKALDLIRELSKVSNDQGIAATLNRLGYRTGAGKSWRVHSVQNTRHYYGLEHYENTGEWLSIEQASKELDVSHTVIRRLIRERTLPASQIVELAPWIIRRADLSLPSVQAQLDAVRQGRQLRASDPRQQVIVWN
jgi:DNA invertase Pin-like site-specific DNA recombinase